jgi:hypothetical protein
MVNEFKTGYAAKKRRERATFYKPLSDGLKDKSSNRLADTFMPAQMVNITEKKQWK